MFGIEVAEVEEAERWSANIGAVAVVDVLEVFAVVFLINCSVNVLVSEEFEDEW